MAILKPLHPIQAWTARCLRRQLHTRPWRVRQPGAGSRLASRTGRWTRWAEDMLRRWGQVASRGGQLPLLLARPPVQVVERSLRREVAWHTVAPQVQVHVHVAAGQGEGGSDERRPADPGRRITLPARPVGRAAEEPGPALGARPRHPPALAVVETHRRQALGQPRDAGRENTRRNLADTAIEGNRSERSRRWRPAARAAVYRRLDTRLSVQPQIQALPIAHGAAAERIRGQAGRLERSRPSPPRIVRKPAAASTPTQAVPDKAESLISPAMAGASLRRTGAHRLPPDAAVEAPPMDIGRIADQVVQMIERRIIAHRERTGKLY